MDYSLPAADSSQRSTWTRSNRAELRRPFDIARWTANRGEMEKFAVIGKHVTVSRLAEPDRSLEHRFEDRGEVAGRGVDDLQDLGSGGLLLQGFARFGQEPRVFHCNDRLRREVLQQRDLLFIKWADDLPLGADIAEQRAFLTQRDGKQGAHARNLARCMLHRMLIVRTAPPRVCVLNEPFSAQQPVEHFGGSESRARERLVFLRVSSRGHRAKLFAVMKH